MKTPLKLAALALLLSAINAQLSTVFAQGSLTPPGAPAPTMKTLQQIEPRTPISSVPFTVSVPGSYYLTTNVSTAVSNAITIVVSGVTLDLNGFNISSTVASAANGGTAILLASGLRDITICNGHIRSGVTNNGSGVYSGSGFGYGIYYNGSMPVNVLVSRLTVSGCLYHGIYLNTFNSTVVESSAIRTAGSYGIVASMVKSSSASDCGYTGIYGDQVSDSLGDCSGWGAGVSGASILNCYGNGGGAGDGVAAYGTAQNCYGNSSSGNGVSAVVALNCYGYSSSGTGIYANSVAQNCFGYSASGTGVSAFIANVCNGHTSTGVTVSTTHNIYSY